MDLGSIATAMVTPFGENGKVDEGRLHALVHYLIQNGSDSIVVCGTTGESPTLNEEEKAKIIRLAVEAAGRKVPVIAGTGSNNTAATIEMTKKAEAAGADGIMLVAPYYNRPDQRGMYAHFKEVAGSTKLPVMLYNVPGRTASRLEPETVIALSCIPNIRAVKEAGGDLGAMTRIIAGTDRGFRLYSGDDGLTLPVLAIGGDGVVSVASHVAGPEMQRMVVAYKSGDREEAARLHAEVSRLSEALFSRPSPAPVKHALKLAGFDAGTVRLPIMPLDGEGTRIVGQAMSDFRAATGA
ncbi:4-hydroxy-tetrahydrodipicolinate synthase [Bhargavaea beijingensis]|uniref:4-hydroxy-tetrahydrodipicolinate synthase n=1 Tax=Bhargavaea beijingensis TaxID=426756 RepID=A0ABX9ZAF5_9BACL|nr:4-hydroxy-tetrahydrodipicolinate synthase [Bhargavaea beijingensis]MCW1928283.1 4-hydroxy-tetrahydrodipicolinate synthase [Bhargavaea beijingensis]RSK24418.1 4-hydroxy-tetrahydrodipicolinate synthase [Bhargavaea beijingensis]